MLAPPGGYWNQRGMGSWTRNRWGPRADALVLLQNFGATLGKVLFMQFCPSALRWGSACSSHSERGLPKSPRTFFSLALLLPKGILASHASGSDSNSIPHLRAASLLSSPGHSLSKHRARGLEPCRLLHPSLSLPPEHISVAVKGQKGPMRARRFLFLVVLVISFFASVLCPPESNSGLHV